MADKLIDDIEKLGRDLMKECGKKDVDIRDKIAIFANLWKFVAVKNKIEPEEEEGNGWNKYRDSAGGKGSEPSTPKENSATHSPADDSTALSSAEEKERNLRTTGTHDDTDPFESVKLKAGGFPVIDSELRISLTGNPRSKHDETDSSRAV